MIGLAVALLAAAALGPVAGAIGRRLGALDRPVEGLKPHPRAVPYLGGLALAGGLAAGMGAEGWPFPWFVPAVMLGLVAVGLLDDAVGLHPVVRLTFQAGLGVVVAAEGLQPTFLGTALAWIATLLLFAGAVNAANMVDGMDGLAGTVGALTGVGLAVVAATTGHEPVAILPLALAGACLGFLVWNLPPARLFLGNSGSYLLGGTIAIVLLRLSRTPALVAGAGTCLGLFGLDLLLAVMRRLSSREQLLQPDRAHLYDQLLARGMSVRACLAACAGIHLVLVGVGVGAAQLSNVAAIVLAGSVWVVALVALAALGFVTKRIPEASRE